MNEVSTAGVMPPEVGFTGKTPFHQQMCKIL